MLLLLLIEIEYIDIDNTHTHPHYQGNIYTARGCIQSHKNPGSFSRSFITSDITALSHTPRDPGNHYGARNKFDKNICCSILRLMGCQLKGFRFLCFCNKVVISRIWASRNLSLKLNKNIYVTWSKYCWRYVSMLYVFVWMLIGWVMHDKLKSVCTCSINWNPYVHAW